MKSIARILNKTNVHFMSILQVYFCLRVNLNIIF